MRRPALGGLLLLRDLWNSSLAQAHPLPDVPGEKPAVRMSPELMNLRDSTLRLEMLKEVERWFFILRVQAPGAAEMLQKVF